MKNQANSSLFDRLIEEARNPNPDTEKLAQLLLDLRETMKTDGDPLVVKVLRMAAEHLQKMGTFQLADRFEDGLPDDVTNLEYFVELVADSENKFNREELQEFKTILGND